MPLPRVFISTDLRLTSEEKDDAQSLIHALLYQDEMNIVGIAGTASKWGHQDGRVQDIDAIIDVYAEDHATLEAHSPAFKSAAELKAVTWQGATDIAPAAGYSTPTASSNAIIAEAKKAAAAGEVLNVLTWGGETDVAQALHDDPSIAPHIRLFNINDQDPAAYRYIRENFRGELDMWVDNQSTFRGMYQTPTSTGVIEGWHQEHAEGHGALGDLFAELSGDIFNDSGVKMGDSPTVLRFISGNQNDPTQESWGGEFVEVSDGYYVDARSDSLDLNRSGTDGAMTIYEDRDEWMRDFAQRLDWLQEDAPSPPQPPTGEDKGDGADKDDGDGGDLIEVRISGNAWKGDPKFALTLNGQMVDASTAVTADRADNEWQTLTFKGDFDLDGTDSVGIKFVNDHYAGKGKDRNLYVDEVRLNSEVNGTSQNLYWAGVANWDF